jgi:hypothetical protein
LRLVKIAELVHDRVHIGRLEFEVLDTREPEEILEYVVEATDLTPNTADSLKHSAIPRRFGCLKIFAEEIEI